MLKSMLLSTGDGTSHDAQPLDHGGLQHIGQMPKAPAELAVCQPHMLDHPGE